MENKIQEVLQQCLERLEEGRSMEECLAQFPEEADRLEPLLQTALTARGQFAVGISAATRVRLRHRVMGEWDRRHQPRHRPQHWTFPVPLFSLRAATVAASVVLAVVLSGAGTVAAAGGAVPGDRLYPVKELREEAQLWFAWSPEAKVEMYTHLVKQRAREVQELAAQEEARSQAISLALDRLNRHLAALNTVIEEKARQQRLDPTAIDAGFLEALQHSAQGQQSAQIALEATLAEAPSKDQPGLGEALDAIQQAQARVRAAAAAAGQAGPERDR